MKFAIALVFLFLFQDNVPFKPKDEFEIKLSFEFKERDRPSANRIDMDISQKEYQKNQASGPLPYLYLNLRVLQPRPEEVRIKIVENGRNSVMNKKFDAKTVLKLDLGFTDDIKDRVGPYEYRIFLLNHEKEPVSMITIDFQEDGTYLVNGEVRGKI